VGQAVVALQQLHVGLGWDEGCTWCMRCIRFTHLMRVQQGTSSMASCVELMCAVCSMNSGPRAIIVGQGW